jgi:hypothetical protein
MSRRKGELTAGRIDREWPYQVVLPADQALGKNYTVTHDSAATCRCVLAVIRSSGTASSIAFSALLNWPTPICHKWLNKSRGNLAVWRQKAFALQQVARRWG